MWTERRSDRRGWWSKVWVVVSLVALLALVAGCGGGGSSASSTQDPLPPASYGGSYQGGTASGDTQDGAAFARWVLEQDPQRQYITDAVVRNEDTLGVKVNPTTTKGDVQRLLEALATGMARTFPNRPLTINAFYQSGAKLAEARFDPTTQRVTVQFMSSR